MPVNFTSPTPSARPLPSAAHPAEEEADHLPQRVEAEAARHHRIVLEMAFEEPEIGLDVEFGLDLALAVPAALLGDLGDAVEHQHRRQRQLRIAGRRTGRPRAQASRPCMSKLDLRAGIGLSTRLASLRPALTYARRQADLVC